MGSSLNWAVSFKIYFSPLTTMLFTMSETFKKSQLSEFFDVPSGCSLDLITAHSCRKVMFSQACIIPSVYGRLCVAKVGCAWWGGMHGEGGMCGEGEACMAKGEHAWQKGGHAGGHA